ncbi:MAG: septum formation inhibitor Maf [Lachnospiraceae bacterium]|nr:septum formation inhibitor Maf [Lachnospiraceae bacterium]
MLILASQSPRRMELLDLAGLKYICIPSDADETVPAELAAEDTPEYLAVRKADAVLAEHPEDVVLGADTLVVMDGKPLGKPANEAEARDMLRRLSGREHYVYTGVAILSKDRRSVFTSVTKVEFFPLSDREIDAYIATGEPMDKAGAYGIQGRGALLVKRIRGDYFTVVGLPVAEVVRHLPAEVRGS